MNLQVSDITPAVSLKPNNFVEATVTLAGCYKNALDAGIQGDDIKTRFWVDASRSVKAFFKKYDEAENKENLVEGLEKSGSQRILAESLGVLKRIEPFIFQWAERFTLLTIKDFSEFHHFHWDIFLDYVVPLTWDWESDLFVMQDQDIIIIEKLLERGQNRIIIIEPKAVKSKKLRKKISMIKNSDNVLVVKTKHDISKLISVWIDHPPHLSRVLSNSKATKPEEGESDFAEIQDLVKEGMINAITFDTTIKSHDMTWVKNGMGNFEHLVKHPHAKCLNGELNNCPAIIVSPGPSLEKNVDLLKNLNSKAIVIAASHSLQYLKARDIIPDVILHVDPHVKIQTYFEGFDMEKIELLILSATTSPDLFELPAKKKAWIFANAYFDNWLMELLDIEDFTLYGSCVSVAALKLAFMWGCPKIALLGQDLSFADGKYYAGATLAPDRVLETFSDSEKKPTYRLPGYYGGEDLKKNDYRVYHGQFQDLAKDIKSRTKTQLFNCTEGGADIKGYKKQTLKDFMTKHLSNEVDKKNDVTSINLNKVMAETANKVKVRNIIIKTKKHLTEAEKLVNQALQITSALDAKTVDIESLKAIQNKVSKKMKSSMFLKIALQDALHNVSADEGYEYTQQGYMNKGSEMYKACLKVIKQLKKDIAKFDLR